MKMTPKLLLTSAIGPALAYLRDLGIADTLGARRLMVAIALQESGLAHRRQVSGDGTESGPAVSWWQCEQTGAGHWLLLHKTAGPMLRKACADFNVPATDAGIWNAIRYNDVLAAIVARLNFFVLPAAVPDDVEWGWKQYLVAWNPGKPRKETWAANWAAADAAVKATP